MERVNAGPGATDPLRAELDRALDRIPVDFGGGCSASKAYLLAWLIRRHRLRRTVDLGVYRGRSLFPQAIAHRLYTGGVAYGVDPWDAGEARQRDQPALAAALAAWVEATDFEALHAGVAALRDELDLGDHCVLVRSTSAQAAERFARDGVVFDLVHADANHDTDRVVADVELYLPRLRPGGFLVLDDVSWESVQPAVAIAVRRLRWLYQRRDAPNDYAVYRKGGSRLGAWRLRRALRRIGA